jgi:hypothetical protein
MTAESKIRLLASADATLQGFFGSGPFRWFDRQLPPGYINKGTCARIRRISTIFLYEQAGLNRLNQPRFQLDVLDQDPDVVDNAVAAIIAWLGTVCFATEDQFTSPPTTPRQYPNFVLSIRPGLEVALKPPVPVVSIDFRCWNLDLN